MENIEYNLNWLEAIRLMVEEKQWIRGKNFMKGYFMKINQYGQMVLVDANNLYKEEPYPFIEGLSRQMFRTVEVATINELSK